MGLLVKYLPTAVYRSLYKAFYCEFKKSNSIEQLFERYEFTSKLEELLNKFYFKKREQYISLRQNLDGYQTIDIDGFQWAEKHLVNENYFYLSVFFESKFKRFIEELKDLSSEDNELEKTLVPKILSQDEAIYRLEQCHKNLESTYQSALARVC